MSKKAMSSSKPRSSDADKGKRSCRMPVTSLSPKSDNGSVRKSDERKDFCSEISTSPLKERKKRHKRIPRKRSLSYSPRREETDGENGACRCLGVFGLSSYTEERDLKELFSVYGDIEKLCLIYDKQSGHSKGFGFVYFESIADAITARKETQGLVLDGRHIRVDYSLTLEPHPSTPGKYQGRERYHQGYRSSGLRSRDAFYYRPRHRDNTYYEYDDAYDRRRYDRDDYDYEDDYDRPSRRYSLSSRRH